MGYHYFKFCHCNKYCIVHCTIISRYVIYSDLRPKSTPPSAQMDKQCTYKVILPVLDEKLKITGGNFTGIFILEVNRKLESGLCVGDQVISVSYCNWQRSSNCNWQRLSYCNCQISGYFNCKSSSYCNGQSSSYCNCWISSYCNCQNSSYCNCQISSYCNCQILSYRNSQRSGYSNCQSSI